jgi:integrase
MSDLTNDTPERLISGRAKMPERLDVTVHVVDYGRKYLYMRYTDPNTGKHVAKSSGRATEKEAVKAAAIWESELRDGRFKPTSKVTWAEFRLQYEDEVLNSLADKTALKVGTIFDALEELAPVDRLVKLNSAAISKFQQALRGSRNLAEATIKVYLSHLQAALKWAERVGLMNEAPTFEMPKRAKGVKLMKGRAITDEEFDRMLVKSPGIVGKIHKPKGITPKPNEIEKAVEITKRYDWFLRGLWWSGLRLGEAVDLSWDESGHIQVDLSGQYPMFVIPGHKQKSGDDEVLPIAPEFAEMLLAVPFLARTGRVFKLGRRDPNSNPKLLAVSRIVSEIGKAANVVVNKSPEKFASAHDFRRAFGERWSTRVMPATLQQMMRHADISTTMKYYVGRNSQKAAADIYAAFAARNDKPGNTLGNTAQNPQNHTSQ